MMTGNVSKCRYSGSYDAIADFVLNTAARGAAAVSSAEEEHSSVAWGAKQNSAHHSQLRRGTQSRAADADGRTESPCGSHCGDGGLRGHLSRLHRRAHQQRNVAGNASPGALREAPAVAAEMPARGGE